MLKPSMYHRKNNLSYRYGHVVALGEGTNFDKFLSSLINGSIITTTGIKLENISTQKPKSKKEVKLELRLKIFQVSMKNVKRLTY